MNVWLNQETLNRKIISEMHPMKDKDRIERIRCLRIIRKIRNIKDELRFNGIDFTFKLNQAFKEISGRDIFDDKELKAFLTEYDKFVASVYSKAKLLINDLRSKIKLGDSDAELDDWHKACETDNLPPSAGPGS